MAGVFELVIFRSSFQVKLFYGAVVRTVIFPPMGLVHITSTQTVEYEQTWLGGEAALLCSSHCADSQLYGMACFTVVEVSRISPCWIRVWVISSLPSVHLTLTLPLWISVILFPFCALKKRVQQSCNKEQMRKFNLTDNYNVVTSWITLKF